MPLLALVLFIATRLAIDGQVVDESLMKLFGRAGLHFAARDIFADEDVHVDD